MMNTKKIYEIFSACRLCGAGGGYKMPIINTVIPMGFDLKLREKIKECVHLEVSQGDKMPPLICELCVDKVNDFYEFLEMVRNVNRQTRTRLGLPPLSESTPSGEAEGDCILGVTEPLYVPDDEEEALINISKKKRVSVKLSSKDLGKKKKDPSPKKDKLRGIKKELEKLIEDVGPTVFDGDRNDPASYSTPTSRGRVTRGSPYVKQEQGGRRSLRSTPSMSLKPKQEPASVFVPDSDDEMPLFVSSTKRAKAIKIEAEDKVKLSKSLNNKSSKSGAKTPKQETKSSKSEKSLRSKVQNESSSRTESSNKDIITKSKSLKVVLSTTPISTFKKEPQFSQDFSPKTKSKASRTRSHVCGLCGHATKTSQGLASHYRSHNVGFTNPEHIEKKEVAELKCPSCCALYPTKTLLRAHHCQGAKTAGQKTQKKEETSSRRTSNPVKNIRSNETENGSGGRNKKDFLGTTEPTNGKRKRNINEVSLSSSAKRKKTETINIPASVRKMLKTMYVRLARCDQLIGRAKSKINVAQVSKDFGFDKRCVYPYRRTTKTATTTRTSKSVKAKPERFNSDNMVSIRLRNEFYKEEDYIHWDSSLSSEDEEADFPKLRQVDSLTALSLKTIFSRRCLGKVPRKLRKMKTDKNFHSFFNNANGAVNDSASVNISCNISEIINIDDDMKSSDNLEVSDKINVKAGDRDEDSANIFNDKIKSRDSVRASDDYKSCDNIGVHDKAKVNVKILDYDSDSMTGHEENRITNADFDSLFKNDANDNVKSSDISSVENTKLERSNGNEKINDSDLTDVSMDKSSDSLSDVKEPVTLNGDDKIDKNSSKHASPADMDGDNILKEIDKQIGESENTANKELTKDGCDRGNMLLSDSAKSDSKYLDTVSDEEFNFDD